MGERLIAAEVGDVNNKEWLEKDFYSVLGVNRRATEADIKKAYRALAMKHHPDANNGDVRAEERFKGIAQAYQVLSKASERSLYDCIHFAPGLSVDRRTGFRRYAETASAYRPTYQPPLRGRDLEQRVVLSSKEARRGVTVSVETVEAGRMGRTVFVRIPPGVDTGSRIKVAGRGGYGLHGGKPGDLYVTARVFSASELSRNPGLNAARTGRASAPATAADVTRVARMFVHFLLNPNDVELNQALSSSDGHVRAKEIIRQRRRARR